MRLCSDYLFFCLCFRELLMGWLRWILRGRMQGFGMELRHLLSIRCWYRLVAGAGSCRGVLCSAISCLPLLRFDQPALFLSSNSFLCPTVLHYYQPYGVLYLQRNKFTASQHTKPCPSKTANRKALKNPQSPNSTTMPMPLPLPLHRPPRNARRPRSAHWASHSSLAVSLAFY